MSGKYYLIYDNKENHQLDIRSNEINIKGNNLKILEAELLSIEDIEQKNTEYTDMLQRKRRIQIKALFNAFMDSLHYFAIIAYLVVSMMASFFDNSSSIGFALACYSLYEVRQIYDYK